MPVGEVAFGGRAKLGKYQIGEVAVGGSAS